MALKTIILAAGQGTRMKSRLPKVLHRLAGKPLLRHVYDTAKQFPDNRVAIVYGHGGAQLRSSMAEIDADWYEQSQQLGTGHAVEQALPHVRDTDEVLVLYGDVPLLSNQTIGRLLAKLSDDGLSLLTIEMEDPYGYGRIVRNDLGEVTRIVEQKDATTDEQNICEINTGVMAVNGSDLKRWVSQLDNQNAQKEFYLTDLIEMAVNDGKSVETVQPDDAIEVVGVNSRKQLVELERAYQEKSADQLMTQGVSLIDHKRFDLRGTIHRIGQDVVIDVNVILEGDIEIGDDVYIGSNCYLKNVSLGDRSVIEANSVLENATVGAMNVIGPFARLRPGTELSEGVKIGNFVEVKKSKIGDGSKVNHLSYVGDAEIGKNVNVGAGTITCNYDGANKFKTIIKDGAFIGSDTQLVAPVVVGVNATIGAGSTICKDSPDNALTLTRAKQLSIPGWKRPQKEK